MGELVMSRINLDAILSSIEKYKNQQSTLPYPFKDKPLIIEFKKCDLSKVLGHKKSNVEIIRKAALDAGFSDVKYISNENSVNIPLLVHYGQPLEIQTNGGN
jgi:hypothetical protein